MIQCHNISFSYTANHKVIDNFSYSFEAQTWTSLVWPNGCGKSSLLKIIAWLIQPSQWILVVSPQVNIGYIFQSYKDSLFPRLTIEKNLLLPLQHSWVSKSEARYRVDTILSEYMPTIQKSRLPGTLSGGQQQLLCIMRALILESNVLLLDESFSALDSDAKQMLYAMLQRIYIEQWTTIIMVTHDMQEAKLLSKKILVMKTWLTIEQEIIQLSAYPRILLS